MRENILIRSSEGYKCYSTEDILTTKRVIWLDEMIDKAQAICVINKLLYMDTESHEPIILCLHSSGGAIREGLMIYDVMNCIQSPVYTIAMGDAKSMAAILLAAGEKGKRFAMPSSKIMIHEPLLMQMHATNVSEVIEIGESMRLVKNNINQILAERTGKTIDEINMDTKRDCILTPQEAIAYGLIDHIIDGSMLYECFE